VSVKRVALALLIVSLCGAATLAGGAWLAWQSLNAPMPIEQEGAWLDVPSGAPLARVSRELESRSLLRQPHLLTWYARLRGDATRIHAGEYRLAPGTTPVSLLEQLVAGQVYLHQITIVEGWRFVDMLSVVRAHPAITAGTESPEEIMAALGRPDVHPEGQFHADTYRFARGTTDFELLRRAHEALHERLAQAWENRSEESMLDSPYDALILASIIEKETSLPSERRQISGVFHRRMQLGMRLQTDPTVIYGLGEEYQGRLRRADLTRDTPYNTYTRHGLPPTPIALPGGASIDAAVDPDVGEALYFVATGLPDGSHHFSATLEEHNRAVQVYLERLRSGGGGSPAAD
jgi:UPF0755 protein